MLIKRILYILIFATALASCGSDSENPVDTTIPEIDLREPHSEDTFLAGEPITFDAAFTDDIELGSYSIDVHDNLDGHGHGRIAQPKDDPALERWISKENFPIPEGNMMYVAQHEDIVISENAVAGPYHFIVQAVDKAGNATNYQDGSTVEIEILITNNSQPVVNITNLVNDELEIEEGVRFRVEGTVSDPTTGDYAGMHSMEILLGEDHEEEHDHTHGRIGEEHELLIDADYEGSELDVFMVDGVIQLDQVFESINFILSQQQLDELTSEGVDHLLLSIKVKDEQGNLTISRTVVHIHM